MNWRDEPVRVGDRFETDKGGVVEVRSLAFGTIEACGHMPCKRGFWNFNFGVLFVGGNTSEYYGPIINKIKETTMDSKRLDEIEAKANSILAEVAELRKPPIPELPTKPGAVIESGGVRFMCDDHPIKPWSSSKQTLGKHSHTTETVTEFVRQNGGFKVLLD